MLSEYSAVHFIHISKTNNYEITYEDVLKSYYVGQKAL